MSKKKDDVVRIPDGPVLKIGVEHEQVALLRKRLDVPAADPAKENLFDANVEEAVDRFQQERGYRPDGMVGPGTRRVLNQQNRQQTSSPARTRQILINMERWRWLPNDLGSFYVTVNIPEFTLWVMEDGKPGFTTRVVVGKPDKQTPVFSNEMQTIVFNPYWNVPNSIKMEELLPSSRAAVAGSLAAAASTMPRSSRGTACASLSALERSILAARLEPHRYPQPQRLSAARTDQCAWCGEIPVPQQARRLHARHNAEESVCQDHPRRESRLHAGAKPGAAGNHSVAAGPGLERPEGASAIGATPDYQVPLRQKIPVYITYFTLKVDDDGSIATFRDLYGHDARMASVMFGEPMPFDVDTPIVEDFSEPAPVATRPMRTQQRAGTRRGNSIADAISGFLNN